MSLLLWTLCDQTKTMLLERTPNRIFVLTLVVVGAKLNENCGRTVDSGLGAVLGLGHKKRKWNVTFVLETV